MLEQDKLAQLRKIFEEEAKRSSTILGARIGDIVKNTFPGISVKKESGSLGKFIDGNFSDLLVYKGKHGKDNEYVFYIDGAEVSPLSVIQSPEIASKLDTNKENLKFNETKNNLDSEIMLRCAIKNAVDVMTIEQLRQLILPAGILFDAFSKSVRS